MDSEISHSQAVSRNASPPLRLDRNQLQSLFDELTRLGYDCIGPTIRDRAIVYDRLQSVEDLPIGWTDEQEGGKYRLKPREDHALFGYVMGPHSWKKFLYPPEQRLFTVRKTGSGIEFQAEQDSSPRYAFIGVRSCELHAMFIQDRVFMGGHCSDPGYRTRRENAFIVAVNCGQAGGTCFCVSMKTGPKAESGYDLALTEILQGTEHYFTLEVGSDRGMEVLAKLQTTVAKKEEIETAKQIVQHTAEHMGKTLDTTNIKELFYRNYENPHWDVVATRCLTCANCTMVCPTCFCTTVEDVTDLTGEHAERWRKWDSCFTMDFSYMVGGHVRASTKSRYRQWLTHKLATWIDQFGTSGCVGCGRCITWCPVAIDLTEEVRALRRVQTRRAEPPATAASF